MLTRIIAIGVTAFVLSGCASVPELTRDEWMEFHERTYEDKSTDAVIEAAEAAFRATDPKDIKISHRRDGMMASRPWLIYMVLAAASGTDYYDFTVTETDDGNTRAELYMTRDSTSMYGAPTGGGGAYAGTLPGNSTPVQSTASYLGMWARIDYFLGLEDEWYDCPKIKAVKEERSRIWGHTDNICGIGFPDEGPPAADP